MQLRPPHQAQALLTLGGPTPWGWSLWGPWESTLEESRVSSQEEGSTCLEERGH